MCMIFSVLGLTIFFTEQSVKSNPLSPTPLPHLKNTNVSMHVVYSWHWRSCIDGVASTLPSHARYPLLCQTKLESPTGAPNSVTESWVMKLSLPVLNAWLCFCNQIHVQPIYIYIEGCLPESCISSFWPFSFFCKTIFSESLSFMLTWLICQKINI